MSRFDIQQTHNSKIDVDFRPYTILGACNPSLSHEALQLEDTFGLMLPCNVIVQQSGSDDVEVAAIDPVASMQAITNPGLLKAADTVREKLARAIALLSHWGLVWQVNGIDPTGKSKIGRAHVLNSSH